MESIQPLHSNLTHHDLACETALGEVSLKERSIEAVFFSLCSQFENFRMSGMQSYCFAFLSATDFLHITTVCKELGLFRSQQGALPVDLYKTYRPRCLNELLPSSNERFLSLSLKCPGHMYLDNCLTSQRQLGELLRHDVDLLNHLETLSMGFREDSCSIHWRSFIQSLSNLKTLELSSPIPAWLSGHSICEAFAQVGLREIEKISLEKICIRSCSLEKLFEKGVGKLKVLKLPHCQIFDKGAFILGKLQLENLEELDLSNNNINIESYGVCELFDSGFKKLKKLYLTRNDICPTAASHIANTGFEKLETLVLSSNPLGDAGVMALARTFTSHLKELHLNHANIEDEGMIALADAAIRGLQVLLLRRNQISSLGLAYLVESGLPDLRELDLGYNEIESGVGELLRSGMRELRVLKLDHNPLDPYTFGDLQQLSFPHLEEIDLEHTHIGDHGVSAISHMELPNLKVYVLAVNSICNEGAEAIAKANLFKLEHLNLSGNRIEDDGARAFKFACFKNMRVLNLSFNRITEHGSRFLFSPLYIHSEAIVIGRL